MEVSLNIYKQVIQVGVVIVFAFIHMSQSYANPMQTFGFTSSSAAKSTVCIADENNLTASIYCNPSYLNGNKQSEIAFGFLYSEDFLKIKEDDAKVAPLRMFALSSLFSVPFYNLNKYMTFGIGLLLPADKLYDIQLPDDTAPYFPFLQTRNRRLSAVVSAGLKITNKLSIGGGISFLPEVSGKLVVDRASSIAENNIIAELKPSFFGSVTLKLINKLDLVFLYRAEHFSEISLTADTSLSPTVRVPIFITSPIYSSPEEFSLGIGYKPNNSNLINIDISLYMYSSGFGESTEVTFLDPVNSDKIVDIMEVKKIKFNNVVSPGIAYESELNNNLIIRCGYKYWMTPVPPQESVTNLLDSNRHTISFGLGYKLSPSQSFKDYSLTLDLHAQTAILEGRLYEKTELLHNNPGWPAIDISGGLFNIGFMLTLESRR